MQMSGQTIFIWGIMCAETCIKGKIFDMGEIFPYGAPLERMPRRFSSRSEGLLKSEETTGKAELTGLPARIKAEEQKWEYLQRLRQG